MGSNYPLTEANQLSELKHPPNGGDLLKLSLGPEVLVALLLMVPPLMVYL